MDIKLESLKPTCTSAVDSTATVTRLDNKLIINGFIIAPDPCHKVSYSYELQDTSLVINLHIIRTAGMCIQCLAKISFKITIESIDKELRNIIILYQNKELLRYNL